MFSSPRKFSSEKLFQNLSTLRNLLSMLNSCLAFHIRSTCLHVKLYTIFILSECTFLTYAQLIQQDTTYFSAHVSQFLNTYILHMLSTSVASVCTFIQNKSRQDQRENIKMIK